MLWPLHTPLPRRRVYSSLLAPRWPSACLDCQQAAQSTMHLVGWLCGSKVQKHTARPVNISATACCAAASFRLLLRLVHCPSNKVYLRPIPTTHLCMQSKAWGLGRQAEPVQAEQCRQPVHDSLVKRASICLHRRTSILQPRVQSSNRLHCCLMHLTQCRWVRGCMLWRRTFSCRRLIFSKVPSSNPFM